MTAVWILAPATAFLAALLYLENRELRKAMVPTKAGLSSLFIVAVLLQPWPSPGYGTFILIGLSISLAGDVLLALGGDKPFLLGLVAFLLGHVAYIVAFFTLSGLSAATLWAAVPIACVSALIYRWLKPRLGPMEKPVIAYILVISLMLAGAATVLADSAQFLSGRVMAFVGALLFYLSDLLVARDRFVHPSFANRLVGLPLYYSGQFILAFSTACVG
jgi:uncharacterized membrane protein YhhN